MVRLAGQVVLLSRVVAQSEKLFVRWLGLGIADVLPMVCANAFAFGDG
jgi:hypothetical protein